MKIRYLLGIVCILGCLTGCGGEKKLSCTLEGKDLGKKLLEQTDIYFNKKEVTKVTSKIKTTYENEYKEEIETTYKALEESVKQYKEEDGIKTKLTKGDDNISVELTFDMKKQKASENSGFATNASQDELKKELEEKGYTCK